MEKQHQYILIGVALVCIIALCAYNLGWIHTGSFAKEDSEFGPGKYVVGTDIPQGFYGLKGNITINGKTGFANQQISGSNVVHLEYIYNFPLKEGDVVTVQNGGSIKYTGPTSSHGDNVSDVGNPYVSDGKWHH